MIDLKAIETEINTLQNALYRKQKEYRDAKEANLKEQYGEDFGCHSCAYSCCVDVGDHCTYCTQYKCIYCNKYCDAYMPDNVLSTYIRNKHYYDEGTVSSLNLFFDVSDIMKCPELYQAAVDVMKFRDKKENSYEQREAD